MPLPRFITMAGSLALAVSLYADPGHAENIWSRTDVPNGLATYPTPETLAVLETSVTAGTTAAPAATSPQGPTGQVPPDYAVLAAAPDYNSWRGGPGAAWGAPSGGGFPFLCGSFGFGSGNHSGLSFGF